MPVNRKWPLETLIGSLRELFPRDPAKSHPRHVLIEYVMLRDVNDSLEDAHRYRPHSLLLHPACTGAGPTLYFFTLHAQVQAPCSTHSPCMHRRRPHTLLLHLICTGAGPMLCFFTLHAQAQVPQPTSSPCMHRYMPPRLASFIQGGIAVQYLLSSVGCLMSCLMVDLQAGGVDARRGVQDQFDYVQPP